ncbi:unnamed protein product [Orchesella dallaii]|uniref:Uncharacterized protein n=1 Tax=Orchesella dallaii TaxID=48710 RepID=A0ABP1RLI9_9HEXA
MIAEFNLTQNVITTDTQHEITHIINSKTAFLSYPDLFYDTARKQNFTENFVCSKINNLAAQSVPFKSAIYVKKGSQFQEFFGEKLIFIMERGLNYRYKNEYDTKRQVLALCLFAAAAVAAPNGGGYGGSSAPTYNSQPPTSQSYTGPDQSYRSQPAAYLAPSITFHPPQITYSQPQITYSDSPTTAVAIPTYGGGSYGGGSNSYSAQPFVIGYKNNGYSAGGYGGASSSSYKK